MKYNLLTERGLKQIHMKPHRDPIQFKSIVIIRYQLDLLMDF